MKRERATIEWPVSHHGEQPGCCMIVRIGNEQRLLDDGISGQGLPHMAKGHKIDELEGLTKSQVDRFIDRYVESYIPDWDFYFPEPQG